MNSPKIRIKLLTGTLLTLLSINLTAAEFEYTPVTDDMLQNPDPADWLMFRRTLDSWGYSPLNEVNRENVGELRMVWTRGIGPGIQEGTPLVHDGIMYYPQPWDVVQALDAVTGDPIWEYRRDLPDDLNAYFPVPEINRNLSIFGNLIIDTSADDHLYALDARTGELVWETEIDEYTSGSQQSSGPIIANGKAISGRGCEPEGGPEACVITAHDAVTGKEIWRTQTIPAPGEPGYETWGDVPYEDRVHVGTWLVPSFDPELNMIYIGTSVTIPAPKYKLAGNDEQYLYHNSTLALDADTGEIVWHYQHLVDHWDLDHPFERLLVDTVVAPDPDSVSWINPNLVIGEERKVMTGIPGKTGIIYTLDRETGEFLWATPTTYQTVVESIDGTGKVTINPEMLFREDGETIRVCPNSTGGKNWPASTFSPLTNSMYFPLQNTCGDVTSMESNPDRPSYGISTDKMINPATTNLGVVRAVAVDTGRTLWDHQQRTGALSLMSTGGGLVFGGDSNGRFRAFDQRSGEILWEVNLGSAVTGYPVTYSVGGTQYVAVSTGVWRNNTYTPELFPDTASNLYVFALPQEYGVRVRQSVLYNQDLADTSATPELATDRPDPTQSVLEGVYSAEQAARGEEIYSRQCVICHAEGMAGSETAAALIGSVFNLNWNGRSLGALFDFIRESMPPAQIGRLSEQQTSALVAAILKANDYPASTGSNVQLSDSVQSHDILIERNR